MKTLSILLFLTILIGSCAKSNQYFFVLLNSNPDKEILSEDSVMRLQEAHLKNIEKLYGEGKLVAAGPFDGGGGIFIMNSDSKRTVGKLLNTDPAISAGRFIIEIHSMEIEQGQICAVDSIYNMETYYYSRFSFDNKNNETEEMLNDDIESLSGEVIFKAHFSDTNETILLFKPGEESEYENQIDALDGLTEGKYMLESKKLWIARETFCK
jgi:uncharacterized protein YciI